MTFPLSGDGISCYTVQPPRIPSQPTTKIPASYTLRTLFPELGIAHEGNLSCISRLAYNMYIWAESVSIKSYCI